MAKKTVYTKEAQEINKKLKQQVINEIKVEWQGTSLKEKIGTWMTFALVPVIMTFMVVTTGEIRSDRGLLIALLVCFGLTYLVAKLFHDGSVKSQLKEKMLHHRKEMLVTAITDGDICTTQALKFMEGRTQTFSKEGMEILDNMPESKLNRNGNCLTLIFPRIGRHLSVEFKLYVTENYVTMYSWSHEDMKVFPSEEIMRGYKNNMEKLLEIVEKEKAEDREQIKREIGYLLK